MIAAAVVAAASDVEVYRDPTQPIPARVADLLSRMTLAEKAAQLGCECTVQNMHAVAELHDTACIPRGHPHGTQPWASAAHEGRCRLCEARCA